MLVGENYRCKITDFGMARDVNLEQIYLRRSEVLFFLWEVTQIIIWLHFDCASGYHRKRHIKQHQQGHHQSRPPIQSVLAIRISISLCYVIHFPASNKIYAVIYVIHPPTLSPLTFLPRFYC